MKNSIFKSIKVKSIDRNILEYSLNCYGKCINFGSEDKIFEKLTNKQIIIEPFNIINLQPAGYDLELSNEFRYYKTYIPIKGLTGFTLLFFTIKSTASRCNII